MVQKCKNLCQNYSKKPLLLHQKDDHSEQNLLHPKNKKYMNLFMNKKMSAISNLNKLTANTYKVINKIKIDNSFPQIYIQIQIYVHIR